MDENQSGTTGGAGTGGSSGRDTREELRDQLQATGKAAGELLEQVIKIPQILAQIPMQAMPEDASTHAQNAAREGFEAVRYILDSAARGIEQFLSQMQSNRPGSSTTGSTGTPDATGDYGTGMNADEGTGSTTNGYEDGATQRMLGDGSTDSEGNPTTRLDG